MKYILNITDTKIPERVNKQLPAKEKTCNILLDKKYFLSLCALNELLKSTLSIAMN